MSDSESGPLDLGDFQLKPQWVDDLDKPNQYASFEGVPERRERRGGSSGGGGRAGDRRSGGGNSRTQGKRSGGGNRSTGGGGGNDRRRSNDRPRRDGRDNRGGRGGQRQDRRPHNDRPPLYELLDIEILPEPQGMEAVCRQIKMTGRSYSIFDLAKLSLGGPERYQARFILKPETTQVQLVECRLDDSLWLSMSEALQHFRRGGHFDAYYKKEEVDVGAPKGNFSVIAVCGMSGKLLGPPNFHSYQKSLNDLHQREFSRMHIDGFKRRIKMVRDEETIEKWKKSLSKETHYTYLKVAKGEEAPVFKTATEAERHFIDKHGAEAFVKVKKATVPGNITQKQMSGALCNMLKRNAERQQKFPMPMVKKLSPLLEKSGLKFFKLGEKETYVARSRPKALNLKNDMSPRIHDIVGFIRNNPGEDLHKLVSALVATTPDTAEKNEPTPEEVAVLKDLRWMIREGYVLEFSNGQLRMASDKGPFKKKRPAKKKTSSTDRKVADQGKKQKKQKLKKDQAPAPQESPLRLVKIIRCKSRRPTNQGSEQDIPRSAVRVALKRGLSNAANQGIAAERRVVKRLIRQHS